MTAPALSDFFIIANYIEAALWTVIALGFLLHAVFKRSSPASLVAAAAFLLFGISDVIETRTGAWWRPWWLLVMKGVCLAVFVLLLARYTVARRSAAQPATPDTARPRTSTHPSR